MKTITVLHLSDLHLSSSHIHDQQIVLDAFYNDISTLVANGQDIDAVLFTGDLVAKGDYKASPLSYISEKFIAPLIKASKISRERIFVVPGNHDCDTKKRNRMVEPYFAQLSDPKEVNAIIDTIDDNLHLLDSIHQFNDTIHNLNLAKPHFDNSISRSYIFECNSLRVGVACLNSAWRSSGIANNHDYGKLLVGERQVEVLAKSLDECDIKIALVHHPISWIAPFDQQAVQRAIFKNFDALFHGHNHISDASALTSALGHLFTSNAGCLYQERDYFNGYSVLKYSDNGYEKKWDVSVREYFEEREVFDVSVRYSSSGSRTYVMEGGSQADTLFPTADYVTAVHERVNTQLLSYSASDIAPKSIKAIFVEPPLSHVSERQLDVEKQSEGEVHYLPLTDVAKSDKAVFIIGRQESGKTTLLNYLCVQTLELAYFDGRTHSFYIDLKGRERLTKAALIDAAIQFSGSEYRKADIISLLNAGRAVICFDNLVTSNGAMTQLITEFVSEYSKCKFFFSVNEDLEHSLTNKEVPKLPIESEVVYLHAYGRKHTRQLIQNWFPDTIENVRIKLDAVLMSIRVLNVPKTPFLISILLWIQERNVQFSLVNQAAIIDVFIDGLLEKLTESKKRDATDATIKRHFLAELALHMFNAKSTTLKIAELEKFTVRYFEEKALLSSALPFLQELFAKGILFDSGEEVSFKFECFRAFFLAKKLDDSVVLREYVLSKEGFLSMSQEIDYYTGLHRDKVDILKRAIEIVDEEYGTLSRTVAMPQLELFNQIGKEKGVISPEVREAFETGVFGKRLSLEEQEEVFDDWDIPTAKKQIANHKEKLITEDGEIQHQSKPPSRSDSPNYIKSLILCSQILRNSELINDADLKHEIYSKLNLYWSQMLLGIVWFIEESDVSIENRVRELVPNVEGSFLKYFVQLMIPNVIFTLMYEAMGTTKLEKVIKDHLRQEVPTLSKLVDAFLLSDLEIFDQTDELAKIIKDVSCTRYAIELIFFKLLGIYMFNTLKDRDAKKIQQLIGDVFSRLFGDMPKVTKDAAKQRFLDSVSEKRNKKKEKN